MFPSTVVPHVISSLEGWTKSIAKLDGDHDRICPHGSATGTVMHCDDIEGYIGISIDHGCTTFLGRGPKCIFFSAHEGRIQNYDLNLQN